MEINKYDPNKDKKEKIERERKDNEIQIKKDYFETLRKDTRFQKYIIEEIIDKEIEGCKAYNIDTELLTKGNIEDVRATLLMKNGMMVQLKYIKDKILRD